jgi:DMSO/TMAO reductase YedYZ heme-binding membrane subunit
MKRPDRRYLAWGIGMAGVASLPLIAGFTRLVWEFSEIAGLAAALVCVALCSCPIRPRDSTPPVLLSLARHEMLGIIVPGLVALHILLAVVSDHTVIEYLKPTSPLYQLAGILAFVLLLVLAVTSRESGRRRFWRSHRSFQAVHIVVACMVLALLAAHVIATNRYTGSYGRRVVFAAVAGGGAALLLRRRRSAMSTQYAAPARRTVFGRHSAFIVGVIVASVVTIGALIAPRPGLALREPLLSREGTLLLNFDHAKHTAVNCLACHHNYADNRGFDSCIHCHRSARADLKVGVEARFHDFCLHCHRNPEPQFQRHGPVSGCVVCHQPGPGGRPLELESR